MGMFVKKGDTVEVLSGKDRGFRGEVRRVDPATGRVQVEGVAKVKRHQRAQGPERPGGIIEHEAFIDASCVQVVCPKCSERTRIAHKVEDGKKVRVCKKCGASF